MSLLVMKISNPNLEENEESPESKEKADPAKELDEGVRIISCWMIVLDSTRNHHLQAKVLSESCAVGEPVKI